MTVFVNDERFYTLPGRKRLISDRSGRVCFADALLPLVIEDRQP